MERNSTARDPYLLRILNGLLLHLSLVVIIIRRRGRGEHEVVNVPRVRTHFTESHMTTNDPLRSPTTTP